MPGNEVWLLALCVKYLPLGRGTVLGDFSDLGCFEQRSLSWLNVAIVCAAFPWKGK